MAEEPEAAVQKTPAKNVYRIFGNGAHAAQPMEAIVSSAIEAEAKFEMFRRLCGKFGSVEIVGKQGRPITRTRLASFARAERELIEQAPKPTPTVFPTPQAEPQPSPTTESA
jgi:hypothetical protein